ncbi:MAG TPA: hypothetical protein VGM02_01480 [Acidobacteriaceae bacterium]|jgi:hypothetical protein
MSLQQIPLDNSPHQTFTVSLNVDGNNLTLQLAINFNVMSGYWVLGISDAQGNLLLSSIPLLCGVWPAANLLAQYRYLKIGSAYVINQGSTLDSPDSTTLGSQFELWWGDTAA